MKKSIRNLILGAAMAIGVFAASLSAFAGQFVQNDMNFRSGASTTSTITGRRAGRSARPVEWF